MRAYKAVLYREEEWYHAARRLFKTSVPFFWKRNRVPCADVGRKILLLSFARRDFAHPRLIAIRIKKGVS